LISSIFIPKKIGTILNLARFLIPEECAEMGEKVLYRKREREGKSIVKLPPAQYHDWIGYLKDEFEGLSSLKNQQQRLRGEVLHDIFSSIGNLSTEDNEDALNAALQKARIGFSRAGDFTEYESIVRRLLEKKEFRPFFYCGDAGVFTEKEIVDRQGRLRRLDRLILKEDEAWIVDFKSSKDAREEYHLQVREYMEVIGEMYPEKAVKGYLIYLDRLEGEEING